MMGVTQSRKTLRKEGQSRARVASGPQCSYEPSIGPFPTMGVSGADARDLVAPGLPPLPGGHYRG